MKDNVPAPFQNRFRKVAAHLRIANERPSFTEFPAQESNIVVSQYCQYAKFNSGSGDYDCHQWALVSGNSNVYFRGFALNTLTNPINALFSTAGPFISGTPTSEYHRALAVKDDAVFGALNGKIYKREWVDKLGYQWTMIRDLTDPTTFIEPEISLVAISETHMVAAAVYATNDVQDRCKISIINNTGGIDTWKGFLPKHKNRPALAAVSTSDGVIHIYVDDWSGKKPIYLRRYTGGIWSATQEILPMDALDDDSSFSVGFASKLANGRVFLTGVTKRKYGPYYSIYMLGPDKFTYGRDMVIKSNYGKKLMIAEGGGRIWGVNTDDVFSTGLTPGIFSASSPTIQADTFRVALDMPSLGADRLSLDVPVSELAGNPDVLIAGAMLDLDILANDQSYTLGRFGVDRFRLITNQEGQNFSVDCSSYAMKKLMDWESDTFFDYMGQGESHGDPGELTKLVRFSGAKYTTPTGGGLQLESLNDDGMCYTSIPSSHGGFIRARFTNIQAKDVMVGVGLNYGEETLAEAAARLNKKIEQVTAGERGRWALIALYNPDPIAGPVGKGKVMLMDYNTLRKGNLESQSAVNPWRLINTVFVDRVVSICHLALQYQDGYARVYFSGIDSPDLKMVISDDTMLDWDLHPTEHENYGRGLVFMRNNTGFHMSYPVMSDSDVIPLYDGIAKAEKFYYPLEDRTDKFTAPGMCVIDSELISYSGIAGYDDNRRVLDDLQWVPGKAIARSCDGYSTPTGGGWMDFANSRGTRVPPAPSHVHGNNYLMQCFQPANGERLNAFRIYLKKVNNPEDGLTLSVHIGNVSSSNAVVALLNSTTLTSASVSSWQLKGDGAWVTFYLDKEVIIDSANYSQGKQYWVILKRSKNWTHPSSTTYFSCYKMPDSSYPNNGAYVFCEEDDQAVGQSGDMAFVAYGRVDGLNKEYLFPVIYKANVGLSSAAASTYWVWDANANNYNGAYVPTASQSYWNGCAITITKGAGINNCYRIVRSFRLQDSLNDLFIYALDRDPGKIFGTDTMARSVPALYGLKRGQTKPDNTVTYAAAHGDKSMVHVPRYAFVKAANFEYYTAEEDLTLAEVAETIARKAGVVDTDLCNRHSGTVAGHFPGNPITLENVPAQSKNCIVKMTLPYMGGDQDVASVQFRDADDIPVYSVQFIIGLSQGVRYGLIHFIVFQRVMENGVPTGNPYTMLKCPFDENVMGDFRVSLYNGHLSAWVGGRVLAGVDIESAVKWWKDFGSMTITSREWTKVAVDMQMDTPSGAVAKVLIPQAGTRVDNFVMDMGKTGSALLQTLVGEKRVYYRDDGTGKLKIYTDRETVPGSYSRATIVSQETTDIGLATRVLLEGGEIVEVSSDGNLEMYGNFFKTFNFHEINNLDDAKYFANVVMEDMSLNRERIEIEGAADPKIEPTDIILVSLPGNDLRQVVVDGISHSLTVDETDAIYDMRLSGRIKL